MELAAQNSVNDLMVLLKIDLNKLGDRAYNRLKDAPVKARLHYLGAIRIQAAARSFLVRLRVIRSFLEEASAIREWVPCTSNSIAMELEDLQPPPQRKWPSFGSGRRS